ncbi:DUF222 domain-containing protein [Kineosporia mesophila]|nr:DUF222 domain-containing protein [Kineosporia mesophila]MCD5352825.1 DUF222 domain-containing protein [Kineosporia mesophila]
MGEALLSAWPEVDLRSLSALELHQAIKSSSWSTGSESVCLGSVAASERIKRNLDATQAECLHRAVILAARSTPSNTSYDALDGIELVGSEIALNLGLSNRDAMERVGDSIEICEDLPLILALVREGNLDWRAAVSVNTQMRIALQPGTPAWNAVQKALAARLAGKNQRQARDIAQQEIQKVDPEAARKRREARMKERCVYASPLPDGMGQLQATLSAEHVMLIHSVLDALADACRNYSRRAGTPDPRTHQERRADALIAIFHAIHHNHPLPFIPLPPDPTDTFSTFSGRVVPHDHPDAPIPSKQATPSGHGAPSGNATGSGTQASPTNRTFSGAPNSSGEANPSNGSARAGAPSSSGRAHSSGPTSRPDATNRSGATSTSGSTHEQDAQDRSGRANLSDNRSLSDATSAANHPHSSNDREPSDAQAMSDAPIPPHASTSSVPPTVSDGANPSDVSQSSDPATTDNLAVIGWWLPPSLPSQQGRKPHLVVTVSADTLRGANDLPGELKRFGAISADLAREIARQAGQVTVIPVNGTLGQHAHGPGDQAHCTETSPRYKPRQTVIDKVLGRFQQCVHPGCGRDAAQCDVDHATPFAQGGKSCPCNLVPLCRFHHRLKTHAAWTLRLTRPDEPYPEGTIEWRSRLGQQHIEIPEPLPGEPDRATRDRLRQEDWEMELMRVDPRVRPASEVQEKDPGEPPF